jgi:hypothetical protein
MRPEDFAYHVLAVCTHFGGSETSGRRTDKHNAAVGGVPDSPHRFGLGRDVVYDEVPELQRVIDFARTLGLVVIREKDHDHFQPADWTPQ